MSQKQQKDYCNELTHNEQLWGKKEREKNKTHSVYQLKQFCDRLHFAKSLGLQETSGKLNYHTLLAYNVAFAFAHSNLE